MSSDGDVLLHESAHPEPITLPSRLPNVRRTRTLGDLNSVPFNGFSRGLGTSVHSGAFTIDDAIKFLEQIQTASSATWREKVSTINTPLRGGDVTLNQLYHLASHGLASFNRGTWHFLACQVRRGECTLGEVFRFLINPARGQRTPRRAGLLVWGIGTRKGQPAVSARRTPVVQGECFPVGSMAAVTGASCAAFAFMALDQATGPVSIAERTVPTLRRS